MLADSGNSASSEDRLAVIYQAMAMMDYDAVGVGIMEAGLGVAANEAAQAAGLPQVGQAGPDPGESTPGRLIVELSGMKVAVVGAGWVADPQDKTFRETLLRELQAARDEAQFVVLLSQLGREEDAPLLKSEGFQDMADVVVGGPVSWNEGKPDFVGRTLLLPGADKGREVGVLEVKLSEERVQYHHEMIRLAPDLPESPEVAALVDRYYKERQEQARPLTMAEAANTPSLPEVFSEDEAKLVRARGYLVAPECGRCHDEQHKQWQTTNHSHALQTLIDANRAVRECLACHSEANRRGLPYDPQGADQYGVDCAACHGAGLFHASTEGAQDTIVRRPGEMVCRRCHTGERDTDFSIEVRMPKVEH